MLVYSSSDFYKENENVKSGAYIYLLQYKK